MRPDNAKGAGWTTPTPNSNLPDRTAYLAYMRSAHLFESEFLDQFADPNQARSRFRRQTIQFAVHRCIQRLNDPGQSSSSHRIAFLLFLPFVLFLINDRGSGNAKIGAFSLVRLDLVLRRKAAPSFCFAGQYWTSYRSGSLSLYPPATAFNKSVIAKKFDLSRISCGSPKC